MATIRLRIIGWASIVIAVCLTMIIADRTLGLYRNREKPVATRYLRFREWQPGRVWNGPPWNLEFTDGLINKNYLLRSDENGFIVPSRIYDSPDSTVVFLGGSTTECLFMDELKRFPYLVGRLLEEQTGKKVNSFNGGMSGNTTFNAITLLLGKVIPMNPNVVVMMESFNDLTVLLFEESYWNGDVSSGPLVTIPPDDHTWFHYTLKGFKNLFIKNIYDAAWLLLESRQKAQADDATVDQHIEINEHLTSRILSSFRKSLELFIYTCRLYKIEPVLMTQENRMADLPPDIHKQFGITSDQYKGLYDNMNETVRRAGKENGVLVIDLASRIPQTQEYLYDVIHFTEKGSSEAASIIASELKGTISKLTPHS